MFIILYFRYSVRKELGTSDIMEIAISKVCKRSVVFNESLFVTCHLFDTLYQDRFIEGYIKFASIFSL